MGPTEFKASRNNLPRGTSEIGGKMNRARASRKKVVSIIGEERREKFVGGKGLADKRLGIKMRQFVQAMARFV
jgi:hypothetical protein